MENKPITIGEAPWAGCDFTKDLQEFQKLYEERPIKDNSGGMKSAHMFAVWLMVKTLAPDLIVESGVFKGQSTWLLERACPDARIVSIDPNLKAREYISERVEYSAADFSEHDWSNIPENSLLFVDDHQNALKRMQQCVWFGFRHVIFEDNYPVSQGDCYSLKKAWSGAGFGDASATLSNYSFQAKVMRKLARLLGLGADQGMPEYQSKVVKPNMHDACLLRKWIAVYTEFPPLFKPQETRWGDRWEDANYPTMKSILEESARDDYPIFYEEAKFYTWICYVELKKFI